MSIAGSAYGGTAHVEVRGDFSQLNAQMAREIAKAKARGKALGNAFSSGVRQGAALPPNVVQGYNQLATAQGRATRNGRALNAMMGRQGRTARELARATLYTSAAVGALGAALAYHTIKTGSQFEFQMSRVQAVLGGTRKELKQLTDEAIRQGKLTKFSPMESADALYEIASAGFKVRESMKTLPGVLDLAAASNFGVAESAEIAVNAIRGFNLNASESGRVADVMSKAVNRSSIKMDELRYSLKYVAPVGHATGQSIEDVTAAIAVMGDAGIKGSQAGTSLRMGLVRLTRPTAQVQEGLEALGLTTKDLIGPKGLKELPEIVRILESHTKNLTKSERNAAIARITGVNALSGWLALLNQGPQKIKAMDKALMNSRGEADRTARVMQDNVSGAFEKVQSSFQSLEIEVFQKFAPELKEALLVAQADLNDFSKRLGQDPGFKSGNDVFGAIKRTWDASKLKEHLKGELDKIDWQGVFNTVIHKVASGFGHVAVAAIKGFTRAWVEGDGITKLALGAFFISKFIGWRAVFAKIGAGSGTSFMSGFRAASTGPAAGTGFVSGMKGGLKGVAPQLRALGKGLIGAQLLFGAVDAMSAPGGPRGKLQNAISTATLGVFPTIQEDIGKKETSMIRQARQQLELLLKTGDHAGPGMKNMGQFAFTLRKIADEAERSGEGTDQFIHSMRAMADQADGGKKSLRLLHNEFGRMRNGAVLSATELRKVVTSNFAIIENTMTVHTERGRKAVSRNVQLAVKNIKQFMRDGTLTAKQGMKEMEAIFVKSAAMFGVTGNQARADARRRAYSVRNPDSQRAQRGNARGGVHQFGRPGANGPDQIPVRMGNDDILVGSGEVGVVYNGDQIADMNQRLAMTGVRGGIAGYFGGKWRKHSNAMAAKAFGHGGIATAATGRMVHVPGDPNLTGGRDRVNARIAPAVGDWIRRYLIDIGYAYDPGGGHKSPGHNKTGTALDVYPRAGGGSWDRLEDGLRAALKAGKQVLYGTNGVGTPYPNHGRGNHAHVEWGLSGAVKGAALKLIKRMIVDGPDSPLKGIIQGSLDTNRRYANETLKRMAEEMGPGSGGDIDVGPGALSRGEVRKLVKGHGLPNIFGWIIDAESTRNPKADNGIAAGLTQINYKAHPDLARRFNLYDPNENLEAAKVVYGNEGLGAWKASEASWGRHRGQKYARGGFLNAARGLATAAAAKRSTTRHWNPYTNRYEMMSSDRYHRIQERYTHDHPHRRMPTGPAAKQDDPKKKKPKFHPHATKRTRQIARHAKRYPGIVSDIWPKAMEGFEGRVDREDKKLPHLQHVLDMLNPEYLVDHDENPDTADIVNKSGVSVGGKWINGIDQAVAALKDIIGNRENQLFYLTWQQSDAKKGMVQLKALMKKYKDDWETMVKRVARNAAKIKKVKASIHSIDKKKKPTKADKQRRTNLSHELANLRADQRLLTGEDEPQPGQGRLKQFSEDVPIGRAWTLFDGYREQREGIHEIAKQLPFDIRDKRDEIEGYRRDIEDATGTKPPKDTIRTPGDDPSAELLKQLLQESDLRFQVSQRQYDVFKGLPPFGGVFHSGGVVPGPRGQERTTILQGGERVLSLDDQERGGRDIRVIVEDHRVRVFEGDVERVVERVTRRNSRSASRALPGAGGRV